VPPVLNAPHARLSTSKNLTSDCLFLTIVLAHLRDLLPMTYETGNGVNKLHSRQISKNPGLRSSAPVSNWTVCQLSAAALRIPAKAVRAPSSSVQSAAIDHGARGTKAPLLKTNVA
jgi:hypothetical protein